MADIKFEIKEHIATLSTSEKGWTKELNIVSWNGRDPKYEVRDWSPDHERPGKGATFTIDELVALSKALDEFGKEESEG